MCWSLNVFWTVVQNLFVRVTENAVDACYGGCCHKTTQNNAEDLKTDDYIIIKEAVPEIAIFITKTIENERYFRAVDRTRAEEILISRIDGSCLVRPYKEKNTCIKYIVSVYAQNNFFHLYIRKIKDINKYGIGLEKPFEKLFNTPEDIISYYSFNRILCTNKSVSVSLFLVPIT